MHVCIFYCNMFTQTTTMTHKEAYDYFLEKLVKCLRMNDTLFIAELSQKKLLPGDTKSKIEALPTAAKKAEHLLDNVIKPALDIDNHSSFDRLLSVMENCDYDDVKELAYKIKLKIDKHTSHKSGGVM